MNDEIKTLPVASIRDELFALLKNNSTLVLSAPTGSGKSTIVPVMLYESGNFPGKIIIIEPRVIAARHLAGRVAGLMNGKPGGIVGYHTRYERIVGPDTRIIFMTEGIFLREAAKNPLLDGISVVVLDEFHERNLASDIALGYCLELIRMARSGIKVVSMSATLDTERIASFMGAPILKAEGRAFPVTVHYVPQYSALPVWETASRAVLDAVKAGGEGDVLIFMPGRFEIARTIESLRKLFAPNDAEIIPLHGELEARVQDRAFMKSDVRKIIVATNVAETALTIPGVRIVVDSGLVREARFNSEKNIDILATVSASMSSADQRAGRAGRTAPGVCYRLWNERENAVRPAHAAPEVHRLDLADAVLTLAGLHHDARSFTWLDAPDAGKLDHAFAVLTMLNAVEDKNGTLLTAKGERMSSLPLPPRIAAMVDDGRTHANVILCAAILAEESLINNDFDIGAYTYAEDMSDLDVLAEIVRKASQDNSYSVPRGVNNAAVQRVWRSFTHICDIVHADKHLYENDASAVISALLSAFADQVGAAVDGGAVYQLEDNRKATRSPKSIVRAPVVIAPALLSSGTKASLRLTAYPLIPVSPDVLSAYRPQWMTERTQMRYQERERRVMKIRERLWRTTVPVERTTVPATGDAGASAMLAEAFLDGAFTLTHFSEAVLQWIERVRFTARTFPERDILTYTRDELAVVLAEAFDGTSSVREIEHIVLIDHIRNALRYDDIAFVERMAPVHIDLPNGRRLPIIYRADKQPMGSIRLQHLYDVPRTPVVAGGRVKVLLEILAPSRRPVQVTDDLEGFWSNSYISVRKELAGRYPKHEWR
ncbi:MAG: ATP-dependent helicase HrpB [Spirochaetes bacterium]|nr:ATP-dependent helicase HrpB [Spirochaetota bacterium]